MDGDVRIFSLLRRVNKDEFGLKSHTYGLVIEGMFDVNISSKGIFELGDGIHCQVRTDTDLVMQPEEAVVIAQSLEFVVVIECVFDSIDLILGRFVFSRKDESSEVVHCARIEESLGARYERLQR